MRATTAPRTLPLAALALLAVTACQKETTPPTVTSEVVISEIMYHPVLEEAAVDNHEFIELGNRTDRPIDLAGYRIAGGVRYTFPAGASLPPRGFVVVARNRERLLADLPTYRLDPPAVFGDYAGELDNEEDQVVLLDPAGAKLDEVQYDDGFPWPTGPDALGAADDFLDPTLLPLDRHRFTGHSLERLSLDRPPTVDNWSASPLDRPTPGRPNTVGGTPPALVVDLTATPDRSGDRLIRAADAVLVKATVSPGRFDDPRVEYFVDAIEVDDDPRLHAPLARGSGQRYTVRLPAQPAGSIVRYRVTADRGGGREVIAPRPGDPFDHFAYYVTPQVDGKTPIYQLYLKQADWTRLWDAIAPGRVPGNGNGTNPLACAVNQRWNERVPAVLAVDGVVYDVRVRYQGSFQQRRNAALISPMRWPAGAPLPDRPSPMRAFSWSIKFPRYHRLDGKRSFTLNKLGQSCHGFNTLIGHALFEQAGIPASRSEYVRLYIGGAYFHYMLRIEHMDDDFVRRALGKGPQGDLFKSVGGRWDEGPYGYSDERPLEPYCGYTVDQRYEWNYQRMNNDWKTGGAEMRALIEELQAARAGGLPAIRAFFEQRFALPELTTYMAVINWMVAWDDQYHNHYLYRRPADGRWMMIPTDLDNVMGGSAPSTYDASFFVGQWNVRSNRNDYWNQLKDAFLRAFRQEFIDRLRELDRTVLDPDAVSALADELAAQYQPDEAMASPAGVSCGTATEDLLRLKEFAYARSARLQADLFD
jgi:hypothetical protein